MNLKTKYAEYMNNSQSWKPKKDICPIHHVPGHMSVKYLTMKVLNNISRDLRLKYVRLFVDKYPSSVFTRGVELKLARGGRIMSLRARKFPPLWAIFPHRPWAWFLPPSGHTFSIFSFYIVRMAKSSGGGVPLEKLSQGNFPHPPPP